MSFSLSSLRPTGPEMVDGLAVFALTLIALLAFQSSYGGTTYFILGSIAAVLGLGVAYVGQKLSWPLIVTLIAGSAVYLVVLGAIALPHYGIAGFLPSPKSAVAALQTSVGGWKELITTAPPVGRTGDLMMLPVFAGFVSSLAAYTMARRLPFTPLALIPPVVVLGLGIATGTDQPVSVLIHGGLFIAVAIGWLAYREHTRRPLLEGASAHRRQIAAGVVVLAVAAGAGYAISGSVPMADASSRDIWRQTVTPPFDPRQYPSPLNGYRQYVKATSCTGPDIDACQAIPEEERDPVMFTVEGLPVDVPVRLATMDEYDGLVWQVSAGDSDDPSLDDSGSFERIGTSLPPEYEGEMADVVVTIGEYNDVWIPDVGEVVSLQFTGSAGGAERDRTLAEGFRYNRSTDTAASRVRLQTGDRYEMTVRLPEVLNELAGEEVVPTVPRLGNNSPVPEISNKLSSAELLVINDTGERLDFVRDLMTTYGTYSDGDIEASQIRAEAGHSAFRLTNFVQGYPKVPLIGNAEQYASTYALFFRDFGQLPTRVVMGFMPSDSSLDGPVDVRATDVEAWVELPFSEYGWVAILPTPPRDQTSILTSSPQQPEPDYRTQNPPAPPLIDPEFDQSATASGKAKSTKQPEDQAVAPEENEGPAAGIADSFSAPVMIGAAVVVVPLLVVALAGLVVVLLKRRRRRRRQRSGRNHEKIANGWREVTDYAIDTGNPVPDSTTRREAATFVSSGVGPLAARADAAVWNAGEPNDDEVDAYWADLTNTLDSMQSELGVVDRVKTAISLQSLRRQNRKHSEEK